MPLCGFDKKMLKGLTHDVPESMEKLVKWIETKKVK